MGAIAEPPKKVNRIGLELAIYRGSRTTLCAGCGHNAITERIVEALYEMGVNPSQVAKLSGIGCSSKATAYFLGTTHGFNAVHGRMPSVATGTPDPWSCSPMSTASTGSSMRSSTASTKAGKTAPYSFLHKKVDATRGDPFLQDLLKSAITERPPTPRRE